MFEKFKYEPLPLGDINLDRQNPRIVSQTPLAKQADIISYLFEHEDLLGFIKKIAHSGKNKGAERPYVIKEGQKFTVVEGNTRVAAYKILSGLVSPPQAFHSQIPAISDERKTSLLVVDCSIAPNREALLPTMAQAHFGEGDKSKWGYLGSRKALFDEHESGKSVQTLARIFQIPQGDVVNYLIEYELYREVLKLGWTSKEKEKLLDPNVSFNPPVRFLESKGHKELLGINYDRANLKIIFEDAEARRKLKHVVKNLIVDKKVGLSGPSTYEAVFKDFVASGSPGGQPPSQGLPPLLPPPVQSPSPPPVQPPQPPALKAHALFSYPVTAQSALLRQLMREAKTINSKTYPAAATALLRSLIECLLKHLIDEAKANPQKNSLSLDSAVALCRTNKVPLSPEERKVLGELHKQHHIEYLNLGSHGGVVPNQTRTLMIRDLVDQFVKSNI